MKRLLGGQQAQFLSTNLEFIQRFSSHTGSPTSGQPGPLVLEHLVAEVVRLGFEVVLPGGPLVAHNEKGSDPCHHGKDGHHNEDDVAGGQAWLHIWRLTCRG